MKTYFDVRWNDVTQQTFDNYDAAISEIENAGENILKRKSITGTDKRNYIYWQNQKHKIVLREIMQTQKSKITIETELITTTATNLKREKK